MIKENQIRWVSQKSLEGSFHLAGTSTTEVDWQRSYGIWEHAEEILSQPRTEAYLADAITNLKRAVNLRLSVLKETYHFDKIPGFKEPQRTLEQLAYWDIVRPTMLKQLIDIRNSIEHENTPPPDQQRCLEFLDFVWYFLRSTDAVCASIPDCVETDVDDGYSGCSLDLKSTSPWQIGFRGWTPSYDISETETPEWIKMLVNEISTGREVWERRQEVAFRHENEPPNDNDVFIHGIILGPTELIEKIIRLFFNFHISSGYSYYL